MTQVATKHIEDAAVTADKIAAAALGNGLSGGSGTPAAVSPDTTGGANLATAIAVGANGVAVGVDDDTIEGNANRLRVKANSIGANEVDETDGFTWTGAHDFTGGSVAIPTPTLDNQPATKAYADALRNGIRTKDNALAVATANQTLSGVPSPVDGVTLIADDRILLTGQSTASQNGLWVIKAGAWERPEDFDTGASAAGSNVWIDQGTTYQDTKWECTTNEGSDVIDTNDLAFTQRPVGETVTAGAGLTKDGTSIRVGDGTLGNVNGINRTSNDISAAVDGSTVEVVSNVLAVKDLGVGTAKLAATSVTAAKLGNDVAGVGIGGGNGSAINVDIANTTAETSVANDDEILIHDTSAGAVRAMTRSNFLAGVGTGETRGHEMHLVTSGEVTSGYFTLASSPSAVGNVSAFVVGGLGQVNKQIVGATGATPDFDVLNSNQFHFNNNGAATGLSEHIEEGDILDIQYAY
jgi:hypothetical protein